MKDIKIFACNSAEEFTKNICEYLGIQMGKKIVLNLQMITALYN